MNKIDQYKSEIEQWKIVGNWHLVKKYQKLLQMEQEKYANGSEEPGDFETIVQHESDKTKKKPLFGKRK